MEGQGDMYLIGPDTAHHSLTSLDTDQIRLFDLTL